MNPDWAEKDFYKILGVSKSATPDEIKKKYRKLAKEFHPDTNPDNAKAEAKFKEVSEAYDVVGSDSSRKEYDEYREAVSSGAFMGGGRNAGGQYQNSNINLDDIFGDMGGMFGGRSSRVSRGNDLETRVTISFADALQGVTTPLRITGDVVCASCRGSRAEAGSKVSTCGTCRGSGQVARNVGGFGIPQTCSACQGTGQKIEKPCRNCHATGIVRDTKTVQIKIPRGVKDGAAIRLSGRGAAGPNGGPAGDLIVRISVTNHPVFGRKEDNLTVTVPITFAEATFGAQISVPVATGGNVTLKIPAGTTSGKTFRVKGRGVTNSKSKQGDLLVTVELAIPLKLSKQAKSALETFAKETEGDDPREELLTKAASAPRINPDGE
ncbi:MAG: molecular chaperone DnaJ [Actinobacteria bacterium]|nr:molecular chaperone DnaJ [Actinomycetota bacterium]